MKLKELLQGLEILELQADMELDITGVSYDSRLVRPGDLFVAVSGFAADGHKYIPMALEKGAAAVLCEKAPEKGAFIRVTAYANMNKGMNITVDHAEKLLSTLIAKEMVAKTVYIDDIQRAVAQYFNIKVSDILGSARPKNIAEPRMAAMYLSRKLTTHSLPEIGSSFGKNHATIINAIKKVPELCEKSDDFKRSLEQIERQLTHH